MSPLLNNVEKHLQVCPFTLAESKCVSELQIGKNIELYCMNKKYF